jgi:hypothetical protein
MYHKSTIKILKVNNSMARHSKPNHNPREPKESPERIVAGDEIPCPRTAPMPLPVCHCLHKARYLELRKKY